MQAALISAIGIIGRSFYAAAGPYFIDLMTAISQMVREKVLATEGTLDDKLFLPLCDKLDAELADADGKDAMAVFLDVVQVAYDVAPDIAVILIKEAAQSAKDYVLSTENPFDDAVVIPLADFVINRLD